MNVGKKGSCKWTSKAATVSVKVTENAAILQWNPAITKMLPKISASAAKIRDGVAPRPIGSANSRLPLSMRFSLIMPWPFISIVPNMRRYRNKPRFCENDMVCIVAFGLVLYKGKVFGENL